MSKRNKIAKEDRNIHPTPVSKYISGVCSVCQNDYTGLELHYAKYPTHRK